jgi:hypothetical protein
VVRVDDETPHTRRMQMIKSMRDERTVEDGDERLRELLRQRTQPLAEARAEYESLIHGGGPTKREVRASTRLPEIGKFGANLSFRAEVHACFRFARRTKKATTSATPESIKSMPRLFWVSVDASGAGAGSATGSSSFATMIAGGGVRGCQVLKSRT